MKRHASTLETIYVIVPADALEPYEAAIQTICTTTGMFLENEDAGTWRIEGVKAQDDDETPLHTALAIAAAATGTAAPLQRHATLADGWLARTYDGFPEQLIGRRFAIRGTHLTTPRTPGRLTLRLDAGLAFGSGEHGSTRGCLRALELVAHRRPAHILDMGCGSGILALAAARLLHRPVLAIDIDPWSVRATNQNATLNQLSPNIAARRGNAWHTPELRCRRFDLIFANILARPLCLMAKQLAAHLAPGGTAILAGLLTTQAGGVLSAHRAQGLTLECKLSEAGWSTLVLRNPATIAKSR